MRQLIYFFGLLVLIGCQNEKNNQKFRLNGAALGTTFSVTYISEEKVELENAIDSLFTVVNQSMSTYLPDSDISRINEGDTSVTIDHMFEEVFSISKKVYQASDGHFDPTVGVLVNAWGFGPGQQQELDSAKVDSLLQFVGFNKVQLKNGKVKKEKSQIHFDFNAVAKGYAIDRMARVLDAANIDNYLIEVGGEIVSKGTNTISGKPWMVGIDDPTNLTNRGAAGIIPLKNQALASSGNYRKFRIDSLTGKKYVHTIDPKTGYPKNSSVLAASVIADDCATADAFATAFMAMDLEDSKQYLESNSKLEAYILYLNEDEEMKSYTTPGFSKLLQQ